MSRITLLALVGLSAGCGFEVERDNDCNECSNIVPADADTDTDTDADSDADTDTDTAEPTEPYYDADRDGYSTLLDCNDADAAINPTATEVCDSADNDCDGEIDEGLATASYYVDNDGDGYGAGEAVELCEVPESGYSSVSGDCNDADSAFYPGAEDVPGDGLDTDCDDETEPADTETSDGEDDTTGDEPEDESETDEGSGSTETDDGSDEEPAVDADADGYSVVSDCDDSDPAINPGASEILDNEVDEDCDGIAQVTPTENDVDGDGSEVGSDCDDNDASVSPAATEVCDSVDNDCDGSIDEGVTSTFYADVDGDGYGGSTSSVTACSVSSGYVGNSTDCDDSDASVSPAATESFDEQDNDCDSEIDEDWQIVAEVTYGSSGYYVLNAQVFDDVDELGSAWDPETDTESSGTTVAIEYTTAEYGDLSASCGLRLNVSEGNPATDWLCSGSAIDTAAASVDVWFSGTWYDESDLVVWDAGLGNGSCSALLVVSTSSDCQP